MFQNILFLKQLLAWNSCFGLFSKIKKWSGASFWCLFFAWFIHKNVPYLILSMDKVSMSHIIFFSRYQTECVIKLLFGQLMTTLTLRFFLDRLLKQRLTRKKTREGQNTKIWIYQKPKGLLRWNKNSFWRAIIW